MPKSNPSDCCTPTTHCCPCAEFDGRIVEVTINCTVCNVVGYSENTGPNGQCYFVVDTIGGEDPACNALNGGFWCDGLGWYIGIGGAAGCEFSTPDNITDVVVNSCNPIDVIFVGTNGTVSVVEV